jgi:ATP-dependent exoDNAse (exonuclease V) beta subunit
MERLTEAFKGYEFFSDDHHYELDGEKVGTSVTTLIHDFTNPFDKEKVAMNQAIKYGVDKDEILENWRLENLFSTVKGTLVHEYAQGLWNGEEVLPNYDEIKEVDINRLKKAFDSSSRQALKFYNDYKDKLSVFKDEFIVGSREYDIAGSIDNLLYFKEDNGLVLIDYKTNKEIKYNSFGSKKMLYPIDNIEDCNYVHYCLQLNIYKYFIEKYAGINIKKTFIVYFDENKDNYEIIRIKNLKNEAIKLLETRRV